MTKPRLSTALLGAAILVPAAALACSGAGPKTHVGTVDAVDPATGTLTIVDAETRQPLTFTAEPELLQGLVGHQGFVSIDYENSNGVLNATGIRR